MVTAAAGITVATARDSPSIRSSFSHCQWRAGPGAEAWLEGRGVCEVFAIAGWQQPCHWVALPALSGRQEAHHHCLHPNPLLDTGLQHALNPLGSAGLKSTQGCSRQCRPALQSAPCCAAALNTCNTPLWYAHAHPQVKGSQGGELRGNEGGKFTDMCRFSIGLMQGQAQATQAMVQTHKNCRNAGEAHLQGHDEHTTWHRQTPARRPAAWP